MTPINIKLRFQAEIGAGLNLSALVNTDHGRMGGEGGSSVIKNINTYLLVHIRDRLSAVIY